MRSSPSFLARVFEKSTVNEAGIYMLKIFHSYEWKCVIIDDFIPVFQEGNQFKPVYTSIKSEDG